MIFGERMRNKSTEKFQLGFDTSEIKTHINFKDQLDKKKRVKLRVAWTQSYSHFRQSAHTTPPSVYTVQLSVLTLTILTLTTLTLMITVNMTRREGKWPKQK